ncbi:MAG: HEXXH motif-containing putative peptide modification protein [Paracoccaceae bacterium]
MDLFGFQPDPQRGPALDARMHAELASSLAHLADSLPGLGGHLRPIIARINAGARLPPVGFGHYFQTAERALAGDEAGAEQSAQHLARVPDATPGLSVLRWGGDSAADLVATYCNRTPTASDRMAETPEELRADFAARLSAGLDLMAHVLPDLHAEITGILRQVLLVRSAPGSGYRFDGGSHYQFWGLLLLNADRHRSPVEIVEVLAHEAGHSLLFGLTVDEPLVLNPDEELFASPLRDDPRPMDGIYHATFVSARMAWAMERLATAPALDPAERATAAAAAARDRENFAKGHDVVARHGRLSDTGARIMANARQWVAQG